MSPKKPNEKSKRRFGPDAGGVSDDRIIDASPGGGAPPPVGSQLPPAARRHRLANLTESKPWQQATGAVSQMWGRYLEMLRDYFKRMARDEQVQLITQACKIFAIGSTVVGLCYIYPLLPLFTRIWAVPLAIVLAWWFGSTVFSNVMIERLSKYMNQEF